MASGGASKYSLLNTLPLFDVGGTTLTLGTAAGSITFPTTPRPSGVGLYAILSAETFMRYRINTDSGGGDDGYYPENVFTIQALHPSATTFNARVASSDGTLYMTYYYAGTARA